MGGGSWSAPDWANYSGTVRNQTVQQTYKSRSMDDYLDPKNIKGGVCESRDSPDHPISMPIILDFDVTGSMGPLAHEIASNTLGKVMEEIWNRKPVPDPQIMFMANGDVKCDSAPLQVSQFESSNVLVEQMAKIFLEGGGGGNGGESYDLPWYFAAKHTVTDSWEKRHVKGFLFTIGDECKGHGLTKEEIKEFIGDDVEKDYTTQELLAMVEQQYEVFHIVLDIGGSADSRAVKNWKNFLGERALVLDDLSKLAEVIVSTIQVVSGADKATVINSWDGSTNLTVGKALKDLTSGIKSDTGVVKF